MTRVSHLLPLIKENLEHFRFGELDQAKEAMAQEMLDCILEDYRIKARGGTGSDGVTWEHTKKFIESGGEMLIKSRNLINGFRFELTHTGFRIYNDVEYARRQFSVRPPWPADQLPSAWIRRMLIAAKPYLVKAIAQAAARAVEQAGGNVVRETIQ